MGLRTWSNVDGTVNGTATYYRTGFEWMVENSDEDRIANNRSLVTIRLWISSTSGVGYAWNLGNNTSWKEHDVGNRANITTQFDFRNISGTGHHYCGYHTSVFPVGSYFSFYVYHNSDGTRSLPVSTYLYGGVSAFQNGSTSTTLTLPAIPRYAAITGFTLNKASGAAGLSRLVASWSTDTTCDYVAYSLNGGAWTNSGTSGTSGTFNLNGLTPGTTYTLSLAVKRTDSQLYTYSSSAKSQTTYAAATLTSVPASNLDIDNTCTINYTNPSGASMVTGLYIGSTTAVAAYRTCTGTSYTYTFTSGEKNTMYAAMPTSNTISLNFYLRCEDGLGNYYYSIVARTFVLSNADPTFTTYTIADTNPTTLALTDSDTKIVSGYSTLAATVSVTNKAVGIKGATVTQYKLTVGGVIVDTESWSNDTDVVLTKTPATSATTTVTAIDGRGNETVVGVNGTLIEYTGIDVGSSSAARQSALAEEVDLSITGTFWDESFGTVTNSISATYEYRVVGASSWTTGTTDITPTVVDGAFTISETILGDTALGFDNTKQYEIKVTITDELDTITRVLTIPTSKPWIVLDDAGVGIRTVYDDSVGGALQVGGDTHIDGTTTITDSLKIPSTADVSLSSTDNPIQIGPTSGTNLVMDGNEIIARNNGSASPLYLNNDGGGVYQNNILIEQYKTGAIITDLNNALTDGCYTLSGGSNGPSGVTYGTVWVVNAGSLTKAATTGYCNQTCYDAQTNNIWYRKKIDAFAWSSWRKIPNGFIGDYIHATTDSTSHSFSGATTVPITNTLSSKGTSLSIVNNGIKIGAGISNIKITAQGCPRWDMPAVPIGLILMVNSSIIRIALQSETVAGQYETISVTSYLNVSENDVIYLKNYWETGTQVWWGGSTYGFLLSVEVMG